MAQPTQNSSEDWSDQRIEEIMGNLLRAGVLLAAGVVLIGGALFLGHYGALRPHYRIFRGEPQDLRTVSGTLRFALAGRRRGIIQAGLLLLIATPIARVVFAVYAFARERDWLYVAVSVIVLAALAYSLSGCGL